MNKKSAPLNIQEVTSACQQFVETYNGPNYLMDLSVFLSNCLGMTYSLIGFLDQDPNQITTAALAIRGKPAAPITYTIAGTPCEGVVGKSSCFFPSGVQRLFPEDEELRTLGIESYVGAPLVCSAGQPLGVIALMDNEKMVYGSVLDKALSIVTPRTELELMRYLKARQKNA